ncbi:MAG: DEAD/DEAH box helicase, partial [Candidatus Nitrosotenuis sp.]|nr:DEAD/DEAH box helicase [Candidatus Nitrosotenuis sp.]
MEYTKNIDEVYLEFLARYDQGETPSKKQFGTELKTAGIVRDKKEIEKMIASADPEQITRDVLFSKRDYISYYKQIKEPEPEMGAPVDEVGLDDSITRYLRGKNIERFYKFQEDAIKEITFGQNVVITAPTASGKTEAFAKPVIQKIANDGAKGGIQAVFVYPTKALSRDQAPKIERVAKCVGVRVQVFDGDTKEQERRRMLDEPPQIVITNFDVLHYHMMYRTRFAQACSTVRFLIVDEAHVYSGIFGSNV